MSFIALCLTIGLCGADAKPPEVVGELPPLSVRGVNYYPAATPWSGMWTQTPDAVWEKDMALAASLNCNTVRTFLTWGPACERAGLIDGDGQVTPEYLSKFERFLSIAWRHNIRVVVCFAFELPDRKPPILPKEVWQRAMTAFVAPHRDDGRVLMWDLMNEPERYDWQPAVTQYLAEAYRHVKQIDPKHLVTIGIAYQANRLSEAVLPDVMQYHEYAPKAELFAGGIERVGKTVAAMRKLGGSRPVLIGEFGLSTARDPKHGAGPKWQDRLPAPPGSEDEQIQLYGNILEAAEQWKLAGTMAWCLHSYATQERGFLTPAESMFGLVRHDGSLKPAAFVLRERYARWANPVVGDPPRMLFGDDTRNGRPFAKDPSVIRFGGRYLMYYSMAPKAAKMSSKGWAVGIAESTDLVHWKKAGEIEPQQECERNGLVNGRIILLDGKLHLFYNSYGNARDDAICHATSDDGLTFARDPSNPIVRPRGEWNSGRAIDCDVFEWKDKLYLVYATRDPSMQVQMLTLAVADRRSHFDRKAWTPVGDGPILKPELPWEKRCIEAPSVMQREGRLYLFYGGGYNNDPQQIGCAVSTDAVHWQRLFREPLVPNGRPGEWNHSETGHPGVFEEDGRTYLFVQGNGERGRTWFLSCIEIGWDQGIPFVMADSPKFPWKQPYLPKGQATNPLPR